MDFDINNTKHINTKKKEFGLKKYGVSSDYFLDSTREKCDYFIFLISGYPYWKIWINYIISWDYDSTH